MTWLPRFLELAKKATKGPWFVLKDSGVVGTYSKKVCVTFEKSRVPDADYIASAYPQRIIALAEVVEAARKVDTQSTRSQIILGWQGDLRDALTRLDELEEK